MRVCAPDRLLAEHRLGNPRARRGGDTLDVAEHATADAARACDAGTEVRTYVYDGDSGQCLATIVVTPPGDA